MNLNILCIQTWKISRWPCKYQIFMHDNLLTILQNHLVWATFLFYYFFITLITFYLPGRMKFVKHTFDCGHEMSFLLCVVGSMLTLLNDHASDWHYTRPCSQVSQNEAYSSVCMLFKVCQRCIYSCAGTCT